MRTILLAALTAATFALSVSATGARAQITEPGAGESDSRSLCAQLSAPPFSNATDTADHPEGPWAAAPVLEGAAAQDVASWRMRSGPFVIRGAKLVGRTLHGLKLSQVCFEDSDLSRVDLTDAALDRVVFVRSDLSHARLGGRFLRSAFVSTALDGADASGADLTDATIKGGVFSGLKLSGATLRRFTLDCSDSLFMYGDRCLDFWISTGEERTPEPVDARGADLTEAVFVNWSGGWTLDGAVVDRTKVSVENARDLKGARLAGPVLVEAIGVEGGRVALDPDDWRALEAAWRGDAAADRPSFACAKARASAERLICDPKDYGRLARLDRELATVWGAAKASGVATVEAQRAWLARRDRCKTADCVESAYEARRDTLRRALAPAATPPAGTEAIYFGPPPEVAEAFRATPLYARLAPAFMSRLGNALYVKGLGGDRLDATGEGLWFNGHSCSLYGGPFRFDAKTGWFVGHGPDDSTGPEKPVLRLYADRAEVTTDQDGAASCGVRGTWGIELVRLPVRPEDLPAIRAALTEEP